MSQNVIKDSHRYTSSNVTITAGPGIMFNEITKMKPINTHVNENTNTYAVTVPIKFKRKNKHK